MTPLSDGMAVSGAGSWCDHLYAFYRDKPGLTDKTRWSYDQAFTAWANLIGAKPIPKIRRPDLKLYADYRRDRPNKHGGQLHQKSIVRSLGHIKNFMRWAVTAGPAFDDRFESVQARSLTSEERLSGPSRRALTEEIARAPAALVRVGDVDCIDLRDVGTQDVRRAAVDPRAAGSRENGVAGMGCRAGRPWIYFGATLRDPADGLCLVEIVKQVFERKRIRCSQGRFVFIPIRPNR